MPFFYFFYLVTMFFLPQDFFSLAARTFLTVKKIYSCAKKKMRQEKYLQDVQNADSSYFRTFPYRIFLTMPVRLITFVSWG